MKKYWIGIVSSIILMLFLKSPSLVKADNYNIGEAYVTYFYGNVTAQARVDIYTQDSPNPTGVWWSSSNYSFMCGSYLIQFQNPSTGTWTNLSKSNCLSAGIPTLTSQYNWTQNDEQRTIYTSMRDFYSSLPPDLQPDETFYYWEDLWDLFYDKYGFYPRDDSILGLLRRLALGDRTEESEVIFPSAAPTPTPTPTPTPIPVQTIFVPDGNGNTTIIYQYPDPDTGVITQSPYNPNITNNIEVNCNCDGGSGGDNNPFSSSPQDPYTLDASLFWADGFGVQMSDSPLSAADESQTTLKGAAEEYTSSIEIMSNSFNVLPVKWITLVGLLGGIIILAGLIRTFLGG